MYSMFSEMMRLIPPEVEVGVHGEDTVDEMDDDKNSMSIQEEDGVVDRSQTQNLQPSRNEGTERETENAKTAQGQRADAKVNHLKWESTINEEQPGDAGHGAFGTVHSEFSLNDLDALLRF